MSSKTIIAQKLGILDDEEIQALRRQVNQWHQEILDIMEREQDHWSFAQSFAYQNGVTMESTLNLQPIRNLEKKRAAIAQRIEKLENETLNTYGIVL